MRDAPRALILGLGLLFGCTNAEPAPSGSVEVVRGGEPREALTIIDLREDLRGFLFDGRQEPLELDSMMLVCPNGAWMRLGPWVTEQDAAFDLELGDPERAVFSLAREEDAARDAAGRVTECDPRCEQCPDGAFICRCTNFVRSDRTTTSDGSETSEHRDPYRDPIESRSQYEGAASDGESPQSQDSPDETPSGQPDPSF